MLGISVPSGRLVDCEQAMELQDGPWYRAVIAILFSSEKVQQYWHQKLPVEAKASRTIQFH